jgi:hypothetical protein
MNRNDMMERARQLAEGGFTNDEQRAEFDGLMARVEALDAQRWKELNTLNHGGYGSSRMLARSDERATAPEYDWPSTPLVEADDSAADEVRTAPPLSRRESIEQLIDRLESRGQFPPIVVAGRAFSAVGLRTFVRSAPDGFFADVEAQLHAAIERGGRRAAQERHESSIARHRASENPIAAVDQEILDDAAARAAFEATDAGRQARIEKLLGEIRDAAVRRNGRLS